MDYPEISLAAIQFVLASTAVCSLHPAHCILHIENRQLEWHFKIQLRRLQETSNVINLQTTQISNGILLTIHTLALLQMNPEILTSTLAFI